ncbi:hypothetical protein AGMMS49975_25010 [Clostridia bacterium]|nr:hypothetical protein AGMMS49975_25010 [Clostridia bacterium]
MQAGLLVRLYCRFARLQQEAANAEIHGVYPASRPKASLQTYRLAALPPRTAQLLAVAPTEADDENPVTLGDNIVDGAAEEPFADIETADSYKTVSASVENLSDRHKAVIRAVFLARQALPPKRRMGYVGRNGVCSALAQRQRG